MYSKQHPMIRKTLKKHESMWLAQCGESNVTFQKIDLIHGTRHFKSVPYCAGLKTRELEKFEICKQLDAGVIKQDQSGITRPIRTKEKPILPVFYLLPDTYRTNRGWFVPHPSYGRGHRFSRYFGYWQLPIKVEDKHKTAFTFHLDSFQCIRMSFGLTSAPATFQWIFHFILTMFNQKTSFIYLEEFIIYSNFIEEHITNVD